MENKEKFLEMAKNITRPGIDKLLAWLETTDFYTAPASTKFHGSEPGGLCAHSIAVAKNMVLFANLCGCDQYSMDTLMTVSLFHDLCKCNTYKVDYRNAKNAQGQWEKVPYYKFEPEETIGGMNHGDKSCYLIEHHGFLLTRDEYGAVNCHMSTWNGAPANETSRCYENNPLAWILHIADEKATFIDKT